MINEKYIFKTDNGYSIYRIFSNKKYYFGEYPTLNEAIDMREKLEYEGWPISSDNLVCKEFDEDYLNFSFKVGKSYKHKFMVLTRDETEELIPRLPYEKECDIVIDDIKAKIKLNVLLRLVITKGNNELLRYLEDLSEIDPDDRVIVKFLLNKEKLNPIKRNIQDIIDENMYLKEQLDIKTKQMDELKQNYEYKFNKLKEIID